MRRPPCFLLRSAFAFAVVLGAQFYAERGDSPVLAQSFSDNFNDGNDAGWTRYNPLGSVAPPLGGAWSFPNGDSYRLESPGNYAVPALGLGRLGSLVQGQSYSNFRLSVDISDWNDDRYYVFGFLARASSPGLGTTNGYLLDLNSRYKEIQLLRIEGEVPDDTELGNMDIIMEPGTSFRLIYSGWGTMMTCAVYDLNDLSTPVGAFATDTSSYTESPPPQFASGQVGLVVAQGDEPDEVPWGVGPPFAATFDNFSAVTPTAEQWNNLGGGTWSEPASWLGAVPNGVDAQARFWKYAETEANVSLGAGITVGGVSFDNAKKYFLGGQHTLALESAATAKIELLSGNHEIGTTLAFGSNTNIAAGPGVLTLSGTPNWNGKTVTVQSGTLRLDPIAHGSAPAGSKLVIDPGATVELAGGFSALGRGAGNLADVVNHSNSTLKVLSANQSIGALKGTGATTVAAGANLTADGIIQGSLTLGGADSLVTVRTNGGPTGLVSVGQLSMANGATLDLNDNDLVVGYSGASPLAAIQTQIINGLANAAGTAQIASGHARTLVTPPETPITLHIPFDNAPLGATEWLGEPLVGSNQIIVKYTYFGDLNADGVVDALDYLVVDNSFGTTTPGGPFYGDANLDGTVDAGDYIFVDNHFGFGSGGARPPLSAGPLTAVPEPGTLGLAGLGALALAMAWHRRRSA